jgi:hypothetical protein
VTLQPQEQQMMMQQAQQMMMQAHQTMQQPNVTPPTQMQALALKQAMDNFAMLQGMVAELVAAESSLGETRKKLPTSFESSGIFIS